MIPTFNGWDDTPEDEREELEQWETESRLRRRSSQAMPRLDYDMLGENVSRQG
ncbi:MAG TPA: hypothetical protein VHH32_12945 [Gemmatimonadales bacterium]|nr:hypothetical protein [Gemmatimonadales bacterium]